MKTYSEVPETKHTVRADILAEFHRPGTGAPKCAQELAEALNLPKSYVATMLGLMVWEGKLKRSASGEFELP